MKRNLLVGSVFLIFLSLSNCASNGSSGSGGGGSDGEMVTIPMTPELIEELGPENMSRLSYYLSKDIELRREETVSGQIVFEGGVATRVEKDVRDVIMIVSSVPGEATQNALAQSSHIDYRLLGIEFEEDTATKLGFAVPLSDPMGRFDLLFDNDVESTILYGDHTYKVVYKGVERPYLMVKVGKRVVPEFVARKASGRPIK